MDENQLRSLLIHARKNCPYYSFLEPLDNKENRPIKEYFQKIPLLSRQIVQSQHARLLASLDDTTGWRKVRTTGSSGEPVKVILSREAQTIDAVLISLHIDHILANTNWRQGETYHLTLHAGSSSRTIRALWHDKGLVIKWNLIRAWQESDEFFCDALSIIRDCVVTMMPSVAELLCARLADSKTKNTPRPLLIVLSGEMVSTELKHKVSTIFDCPVTSLYTMAEIGIVGHEWPGESTYQVEDRSAIVEILDENGGQSPGGQEGEIVVTSLNNYAMPLIRYRTGDRGHWVDSNASPPVFRIVDARTPKFLTTSDGKSVNCVRFAKILASLGLEYYNIDQDRAGNITFSYASKSPTSNEESLALIKTVIRGSLGPDTGIRFHKVENPVSPRAETPTDGTKQNWIDAEPVGPDIATMAEWLRQRLQDVPGIESAFLTGSCLDMSSTTRFSDIDANIMVKNDPDDQKWINLGRELKSHIPKLSINFDTVKGFSKRAPFVTVRLLGEQIPLIGRLDETILPRPSVESICLNGLYWTQDTIARISLRVADAEQASSNDPIYESWLTAKWIFTSLRYKYVVSGEMNTATRAVLDRLQNDQDIPNSWKADFDQIVKISREILPPQIFDQNEFERYAKLARSFVRSTQSYLMEMLELL